ncbi:hypothetical protein K502DRAFT_323776 [Neoconidiobolus thromboides FSU 785]|nr:hypothetical protein K502DRAFT_323776 [Neoconidiobolus thromboides FSU 785]
MNIKVTTQIYEACNQVLQVSTVDNNLKKKIESKLKPNNNNNNNTNNEEEDLNISMELLIQISQFLLAIERKDGKDVTKSKYWVHELVSGSSIYFNKPKTAKRDEQLDQRLQEINTDNENQAYYRMVTNVDPTFRFQNDRDNDNHHPLPTLSENIKETNQQLTAIVNIALTIVAVFVAVYWVSYTFSSDISLRVLLSFFASLIVGVAEAFLYIRYLNNQSNQLRPL